MSDVSECRECVMSDVIWRDVCDVSDVRVVWCERWCVSDVIRRDVSDV